MKKQILRVLILCSALAYISSCSMKEDVRPDTVEVDGERISAAFFEPGMVRVKLSEEMLSSLCVKSDGEVDLNGTNVKSLDNAIYSIGITRMERTFPYAGKFEPRTRKAGLHLWYDVYFDESAVLSKAGNELSGIEGIDIVEYRPIMMNYGGTVVEVSGNTAERSGSTFFDDPQLPDQWHYFNDLNSTSSKEGSDINVVPVWEMGVTGSPDVIVCVVDGGVDWAHEDLADNMWHNPDKTGKEMYGYNFVHDNYEVTADDHGTHVAGTIAAVNNNGRGVCGIAGGDKKAGIPGAKIMSCQIFEGEDGRGSGARAIKWGADHGAVISQNSWGYSYKTEQQALSARVPQSDKDAIDYFTNNAGFDENGVQVGPMAGGLVIFAAGNDGWEIGLPGCYETCLAVSSIGADYKAAYYTNYGDWTDIIATGGDTKKRKEVRSTLPGNRYGDMQGTSMACPHVSGVAALIISYAGGPGFTSQQLRDLLENTARDITEYNPGKALGSGLVDAYAAVSSANALPPAKITDLTVSARSNFIDCTMTIPNEEGYGKPKSIVLYYDKAAFDNEAVLAGNVASITIPMTSYNLGDKVEATIENLEFNTKYYVAAIAKSYMEDSEMSDLVQVTTGDNHAPVITPVAGTELIPDYAAPVFLDFTVKDEDGHKVSVSVTEMPGISVAMTDDETARVTANGKELEFGLHKFTLIAEDTYGMKDEIELSYNLPEKHAPEKLADIEDVVFNSLDKTTIRLEGGNYFVDPDGSVLNYSFTMSNNGIVNLAYANNGYNITPQNYGVTEVTVTAADIRGNTVSSTFNVLVRNGGRYMYDLYPNPVVDMLNIRSGAEENVSVQIRSNSGAVVYSNDNVQVAPFAPYAVDMKDMRAGIYTVVIKGKETEYKTNISKI